MPRIQTLISDALDVVFNQHGEREKRFPFLVNTHMQIDYSVCIMVARLDDVFDVLQGDIDALSAKPLRTLPVDYYLDSQNLIIEIDELQHFTPMRHASLSCYASSPHIGFNMDEYKELSQELGEPALFRGAFGYRKPTHEFNFPNGRCSQRAYFDAMKDVLPVVNGIRPTIRIPVPALRCNIFNHDELVLELKERLATFI